MAEKKDTTENSTDKIKKILFNEVTFLISIVAVAIGICLFITRADADLKTDVAVIKEQVNTIKGNDIKHIESGILDLNSRLDKIENKLDNFILK